MGFDKEGANEKKVSWYHVIEDEDLTRRVGDDRFFLILSYRPGANFETIASIAKNQIK